MASLYIHIPFCERKCVYCDFYSVESLESVHPYVQALLSEIDLQRRYAGAAEFDTLYFGGGTPSLLTPAQLETILTRLRSTFTFPDGAEVTLEVNPGTASRTKLEGYRALGVNRLSIGVQSFFEDELRFLGRIHDRVQAVECVEAAREAGFDNISVDLIYALPGQTVERWRENLQTLLGLGPQHVSAYSLIIEKGTPLAHMVKSGAVTPAGIEAEAALYEYTMLALAGGGYEHYEISNYALPGFRSRHNSAYWRHEDYLGFGPSAHSFWKGPGGRHGRRWSNVPGIAAYLGHLNRGELPVGFQETVSTTLLINEKIFLGLRSDGLNLRSLRSESGVDLRTLRGGVIDGLLEQGSAVLVEDLFRLTPKGYLLCDEISERMML